MNTEPTLELTADTLRSEQRKRWSVGDRVRAEAYLQAYPEVRADTERALELIYNEVVLREEFGETPLLPEYLQRFPQFEQRLRLLFEVHQGLAFAELFSRCGSSTSMASGSEGLRPSTGPTPAAIPGYEILREVGRGGMGVVYLARQIGLNRPAALKMILTGDYTGSRELARFRTEVEAVGRVQHSNIVQIYEVGEENGRPYLAMEYVSGGSLAQQLVGAPVAARAAAGLVETLARAVHAAHDQGVVHRDLKPANVLLQHPQSCPWPSGSTSPPGDSSRPSLTNCIPKITDFGLAKILVQRGAVQTQSGTIVGTPSYMAPEQAAGRTQEIGPKADIYSLGAILYELLTGRPPFLAETQLETLLLVQSTEPVSPSRLQPRLPRDLVTVCLKCLQREPHKRYTCALDLAEDLGHFLAGEPIRARPVGNAERAWRWCRRKPVVAALSGLVGVSLVGVALVSLVAAVWLDAARTKAQQAEYGARLAENETTNKLWDSLLAQAEAGRRGDEAGRRHKCLEAIRDAARIRGGLKLRNEAIACMALVDLHVVEQWDDTARVDCFVAWDAALERYACSDGLGSVSIRRVADRTEALSWPDPFPSWYVYPEFSPDGRYLAVGYYGVQGTNQCVVWDLAERKEVLKVPLIQPSVAGWCFCFSPDSRRIVVGLPDSRRTAVVAGDLLLPVDRLALFDLAQQKEIMSLGEGLRPDNIAFHPAGNLLAISCKQNEVRIIDIGQMKSMAFHVPGGTSGLAWSADGRLLAAGCTDTRIYVWNTIEGRLQSVLEGHQALPVHLTFNHAGDLLASHSWDSSTRLWDPVSGRHLVTAQGAGTRFSLDDRRLAFRYNAPTGLQIGFWDIADGRICRTLHHGDFGNRTPWSAYHSVWSVDFSADGRLLASASGDGVRLWQPASGAQLALLPAAATNTVRFEPGGAHVLTHGQSGLVLWPLVIECHDPGASLTIGHAKPLGISGGPEWSAACWSHSGGFLAAVDRDTGRVTLLNAKNPEKKAAYASTRNTISVDLSGDEQWFATGSWKANEVLVRKVSNGEIVQALPTVKTTTGTATVAFSPGKDGKWLVTGGQGDYRFWRVGSWKPGPVIIRDNELAGPGRLAFAKDGQMLAIAWSAQIVKLIDGSTGAELAALSAPDAQVITGLCFSPDGSQLAAATDHGVIQLWDLREIRRQLAAIGLDWEPPCPAPPPEVNRQQYARVTVKPAPSKDFSAELRLATEKQQRGVPELKKSIGVFSEALKKHPRVPELYTRRASIYLRLNQYEEAVTDLQNALRIDPNQPAACNELAWIYVAGPPQLRDSHKALPLAEKAVRLSSHDSDYGNTLGVVLYRLGRFDAAIDCLMHAVQQHHGEATAHDLFFLAMSHYLLGETASARAYYDRALRWWQTQRDLSAQLLTELYAFRKEADAVLGIGKEP